MITLNAEALEAYCRFMGLVLEIGELTGRGTVEIESQIQRLVGLVSLDEAARLMLSPIALDTSKI
jgi:hypothetical protein